MSQLDGLGGASEAGGEGSAEEAFVAALRARRPGEIGRALSGFGPHRDDLRFAEEGSSAPGDQAGGESRDLRLFGSQGEQRAAVLALLLAERAVAADVTGDVGALLLDDVMSELDDPHRRLLVGALTVGGQAIITTTNRLYFADDELARARVIDIAPVGPDAERGPAEAADDDRRGSIEAAGPDDERATAEAAGADDAPRGDG